MDFILPRIPQPQSYHAFADQSSFLRVSRFVIISNGRFLTAFGFGYYHLDPGNDRLMWDRLPMTIVFMSLVAALIAQRISLRVGLWLLPVLLVIGLSSVVQWHMSEMRVAGDLRFYGAVRAYSVNICTAGTSFPNTLYPRIRFTVDCGIYVLAKVWKFWTSRSSA